MDHELIKDTPNPLREALFVALCMGILILYCSVKAIKESSLAAYASDYPHNLVGLALIVIFLIAYWRRHVLAWWVAAAFLWCYIGVGFEKFASGYLAWRMAGALAGTWCFLIWPYLKRNYRPYKEYIGR